MPGPRDVNVVNVITLVAFAILSLTVATFAKAISKDTIGAPLLDKQAARRAKAWQAWTTSQSSRDLKKAMRMDWQFKLLECYWCNSFWISLVICTAALPLGALAYGKPWWWGLAAVPFVFPGVRYAAAWVIDQTVKVD